MPAANPDAAAYHNRRLPPMTPEFAKLCADAAAASREEGLPVLVGTPAQVRWAEKLRRDTLARLHDSETKAAVAKQTLASFWIDSRDWTPRAFAEHFDTIAKREKVEIEVGDVFGPHEARPPKVTDSTVFHVTVSSSAVQVRLENHTSEAIDMLKALRFRYNGERRVWRKTIGVMSGPALDRAADVVAGALRLGAVVRSNEHSLFELATQTIEPEWPRWIKGGKSAFILVAHGSTPEALAHIPGVRRRSGAAFVPTRSFESLVQFADEHGFRWTPSGRDLLERVRAEHVQVMIVEPAPAKTVVLPPLVDVSLARPSVPADLRERPTWVVRTPLLRHQQAAVEKLLGLRVGALMLEMGLGKTLTMIEIIRRRQAAISRVVWACPCSVRATIRDELAKHTTLGETDVVVLDGRQDDASVVRASWFIVGLETVGQSTSTYALLERLVDDRTCIVVDESGLIKGPTAKRTLRLVRLGLRARYRYVLNGTAISQGIEDLYAQFLFLDRRILGYPSFYSFSRAHLVYSEQHQGLITERKGHAELAAAVAPYSVQVRRSECIDLPPKTYSSRTCWLTDPQTEAYEDAKARFLDDIADRPTADTGVAIYKLFTSLQKTACGIADDGADLPHHRIAVLLEICKEIPEDAKVIVWAKYRKSLRDIKEALAPLGDTHAIFGSQRARARNSAISAWKEHGRFLVATQSVGSMGLNLTEASYMVFYANGFKASERMQAEDRAHRIGQERTLHIIDIWAACGIEDRVRCALAKKEDALETFRREVHANLRQGVAAL